MPLDETLRDDFCNDVRREVETFLKQGIDRVQASQDAMWERLRHTNTRGMSFPTGGFSVTANRDHFHLNFPSQLADAETVAAVLGKVDEACERHGVHIDVTMKVKGGSNYVLEGRLSEAPAPGPTP